MEIFSHLSLEDQLKVRGSTLDIARMHRIAKVITESPLSVRGTECEFKVNIPGSPFVVVTRFTVGEKIGPFEIIRKEQ